MDLALSFASARALSSPSAFEEWLEETSIAPGAGGGAITVRLGEFRHLQAGVSSAFDAASSGRPLPPGAVERLNEASALVPFAPRLSLDEGARLVQEPPSRGRAVDVLAAIARSAIRLLGSPDAARLRRCPACGDFFLATRPDRVWCGPACGNRARVARHHARRRG